MMRKQYVYTITVHWCDGRVTTHTFSSYYHALDVVSGGVHPYKDYRIVEHVAR